jgi:succinate dehydrogenase / fumarate reductase, cytochrome b subunit
LNWLKAFLTSSVGRKHVMGLTGLFLCLFVFVHLLGNLMMYAGRDVYNAYAEQLHSSPEILLLIEIVLYTAFAVHIYLAFTLAGSNTNARAQRYAGSETKVEGRVLNVLGYTPDNTMMLTGLVGLLFLIVHVSDFKIEYSVPGLNEVDGYDKAVIIVSQLWRGVLYIIGSVFLGIHISHGLQSAFQSTGVPV